MRGTRKAAAVLIFTGVLSGVLTKPAFSQWSNSQPSYDAGPQTAPDQYPSPNQSQAPYQGQSQPPYQYESPAYDQKQPPYAAPQPAYAPPRPELLSLQQLQNLVAPVALYPDPLLSQVLAASTYPAEVRQAGEWLQQNPGLRGPQLIDAARRMNWDPSVQALVAFPDVLALLNRDPQWTADLGNAFLAQQADVFNAVQQMRGAAEQSGRLASNQQQTVTQQGPAIQIQPVDPQTMYVPSYNPAYVWGPPPVGAYPPLGYPAPGLGILFGAATFLGSLFAGLLGFGGWGWGLSWAGHSLLLNGLFLGHFGFGGGAFARGFAGPSIWAHNPAHRMGVPYSSMAVATRFHGSFGGSRAGAYRAGAYNGGGFSSQRPFAGNSYRASGPSSPGTRSFGSPQGYSRSYSSPSTAYNGGFSYNGGQQRSYNSAPSRSYSPSYSARGSMPSGGFGNNFAPRGYGSGAYGNSAYGNNAYGNSAAQQRGFSGAQQHFSAPRSSGGGHFSAPHYSGGGRSFSHSGGGHSSGGHSGGGHHR